MILSVISAAYYLDQLKTFDGWGCFLNCTYAIHTDLNIGVHCLVSPLIPLLEGPKCHIENSVGGVSALLVCE